MSGKGVIFFSDLQQLQQQNRARRSAPKSKPEQWPSVAAADGTKEETFTPERHDKNSFERKIGKSEDENYHVIDYPGAVKELSRLCRVPGRVASELLDSGSDDLPAVKPYGPTRDGRGKLYRADALADWAERYLGRKKKATDKGEDVRQPERRLKIPSPAPWQSGIRVSELADVDGVSAGRALFGDACRDRHYRQGGRFLASDFFRS